MLIYALPRSKTQLGLLRRGDWLGIALMAVGLAALQTVLDEGNVYDWFGSPFIVKLSLVSALALGGFLIVEFTRPEPLLNLRLLARRNFGFGTLANFLLGVCAVWLGLPAAAVPRQRAGLRRAADRRGHGLDRTAAACRDPVRAAADALDRRPPAGRQRPGGVRRKLFHEPEHGRELRGAAVVLAGRDPRAGPGGRDRAAGRHRDGRHRRGRRPAARRACST